MSKSDLERAQLDKLMASLHFLGWPQPSSISKHEGPDFILKYGQRSVGVEVTLAVEGELFRAVKLMPGEATSITNLQDRTPARSDEEIRRDARGLNEEQTWPTLDQEKRRRIRKVKKSLEKKRKKLNGPGFRLFTTNWLLISDLHPASPDTAYMLREGLQDLFFGNCLGRRDFDAVFVHLTDSLFVWKDRKFLFYPNLASKS